MKMMFLTWQFESKTLFLRGNLHSKTCYLRDIWWFNICCSRDVLNSKVVGLLVIKLSGSFNFQSKTLIVNRKYCLLLYSAFVDSTAIFGCPCHLYLLLTCFVVCWLLCKQFGCRSGPKICLTLILLFPKLFFNFENVSFEKKSSDDAKNPGMQRVNNCHIFPLDFL